MGLLYLNLALIAVFFSFRKAVSGVPGVTVVSMLKKLTMQRFVYNKRAWAGVRTLMSPQMWTCS
jgi:hypothetical protein